MSEKIDLHLISFDVPYPPNYGGLIDVFYKLKALKELGVNVALHCFQYGKEESLELQKYAVEVNYYPRKSAFWSLVSSEPYIVKSRSSKALIERLCRNKAPILCEGIHTSAVLAEIENRRIAIRIHNREDHYYAALASQTNSWLKKIYFKWESSKLFNYELELLDAETLFCLSNSEQEYYHKVHPNSQYLAVFHPYVATEAQPLDRDESYALYYGQLSVEENSAAVGFLLEVFKDLDYQLKIVGRNADPDLIQKMKQQANVKFIEDASDEELEELIQKAKVCCLPSRQNTGIKLKWIQALFAAREIMVSKEMMADENFQDDCIIATDIADWREKLDKVFIDHNSHDYANRKELASKLFDNRKGARILKEWCAQVQ